MIKLLDIKPCHALLDPNIILSKLSCMVELKSDASASSAVIAPMVSHSLCSGFAPLAMKIACGNQPGELQPLASNL